MMRNRSSIAVQAYGAEAPDCPSGGPLDAFKTNGAVRPRPSGWRKWKSKPYQRESNWKQQGIVGFTATYAWLFAQQDGQCALCGAPPKGDRGPGKVLVSDHDLGTGAVRALLCASCHHDVGVYEKRGAMFFVRIARYLRRRPVARPPFGRARRSRGVG
jgi:recombination endonuclease VII